MGVDSATGGCDLSITLVHGTWARGLFPPLREKGRWFAEGSDFRTRLGGALAKHGLSFRMHPFLWSGANSIRERDKAARELAEHVRANQLEHPRSPQVVIAHSHGGNIALRALDNPDTAQANILIVTIATPFVEILAAKESKLVSSAFSLAAVMSLLIIVNFPTLSSLEFIRKAYQTSLTVQILVTLVFSGLIGLWWRKLVANRALKADELVRLTSLSASIRRCPLLILRALDDEASLSLLPLLQ
jgi:hypothetical protein